MSVTMLETKRVIPSAPPLDDVMPMNYPSTRDIDANFPPRSCLSKPPLPNAFSSNRSVLSTLQQKTSGCTNANDVSDVQRRASETDLYMRVVERVKRELDVATSVEECKDQTMDKYATPWKRGPYNTEMKQARDTDDWIVIRKGAPDQSEEGWVMVDDDMLKGILVDHILTSEPFVNIRKHTPEQVARLVRSSNDSRRSSVGSRARSLLYFAYSSYSWLTYGVYLYKNPIYARLVARSMFSMMQYLILFII